MKFIALSLILFISNLSASSIQESITSYIYDVGIPWSWESEPVFFLHDILTGNTESIILQVRLLLDGQGEWLVETTDTDYNPDGRFTFQIPSTQPEANFFLNIDNFRVCLRFYKLDDLFTYTFNRITNDQFDLLQSRTSIESSLSELSHD